MLYALSRVLSNHLKGGKQILKERIPEKKAEIWNIK